MSFEGWLLFGFAASLGILTANIGYFVLSGTSVGAVLVASVQAFTVIKLDRCGVPRMVRHQNGAGQTSVTDRLGPPESRRFAASLFSGSAHTGSQSEVARVLHRYTPAIHQPDGACCTSAPDSWRQLCRHRVPGTRPLHWHLSRCSRVDSSTAGRRRRSTSERGLSDRGWSPAGVSQRELIS